MIWNGKKIVMNPCAHCGHTISQREGSHFLDGDTTKPYHFQCRADVYRQRAHEKLNKLRAAAMV